MSRQVSIAALQTHHDWNQAETVARVLDLAHKAADAGAQVILSSELFEAPYFCKTANLSYRELARPAADPPHNRTFSEIRPRTPGRGAGLFL
jgi:N-carbamoylputrescine amidase